MRLLNKYFYIGYILHQNKDKCQICELFNAKIMHLK